MWSWIITFHKQAKCILTITNFALRYVHIKNSVPTVQVKSVPPILLITRVARRVSTVKYKSCSEEDRGSLCDSCRLETVWHCPGWAITGDMPATDTRTNKPGWHLTLCSVSLFRRNFRPDYALTQRNFKSSFYLNNKIEKFSKHFLRPLTVLDWIKMIFAYWSQAALTA